MWTFPPVCDRFITRVINCTNITVQKAVPLWISSNSGKIFALQKKIVRFMAGAQPRTLCRSLFKNDRFCPFHVNICFHLWTLLSVIKKIFKQIHGYTILIQGISTIFINQMLTYLVFKKVHCRLASEFSTVCRTLW